MIPQSNCTNILLPKLTLQKNYTMKNIAAALVKAQMEMDTATKGAKNPFFKSAYADLNSIREACMPALNKHGIVVLQPTVHIDGKNFVKTVLLHESGETIEGLTEIIYSKVNDAQAQGSGITYARRYGLQSLCNVGAEDDDGNKASAPQAANTTDTKSNEDTRAWLTEDLFKKALDRINAGEVDVFEKTANAFKMKKEYREQLKTAAGK